MPNEQGDDRSRREQIAASALQKHLCGPWCCCAGRDAASQFKSSTTLLGKSKQRGKKAVAFGGRPDFSKRFVFQSLFKWTLPKITPAR